MGLMSRFKQVVQVVVGGVSVGRQLVKGATINGGALRPKQGEEWLHAYNTMPWLRANVSKIAGGVASLEWGIGRTMDAQGVTIKRPDIQRGGYDYRRKALAAMEDEEKYETTFEHPFLDLLKNPCPALPGKAALILAQVYYEIVGEVFLVVDRGPRDYLLRAPNGRLPPTALWPIPPHWVKRIPTPDNPTFEIRQTGIQMDRIPLTEVLWLKNPDPVNPYARGVGIFNSLSDELDSDENAARMISYSFYNRNRPDVLVTLPNADETELRAFKADWLASLQGVQNSLKSHFVNVDAKVEQIGYDFREMQVINLRQHTRDTIRQVPGVPPEILGIQDQSNRATIDAAEYIFGKHVIIPRAEVWRDFFQSQLLCEFDDRAVLDYVTPVQEDKNFTLNVVTGRPEVVKVNEVRKLGGLPALTAEEGGDLFFVNGAFVASLLQAPAPGAMPGAPGGPGAGLTNPGFEGGINVPGAAQMHLSVPGAAGSPESGQPAQQITAGLPPPTAPPPGPKPTSAPPVPDGNGPGYTLAGRPKFAGVTKAALAREREARLTPDEAMLVTSWMKSNHYTIDLKHVRKTAPIPVCEDKPTEWLRRALAYLNDQPLKAWDSMLGPWGENDRQIVDRILAKGFDESQPRDDQGRWTDGGGSSSRGGETESRGASHSKIAREPKTMTRHAFDPDVEKDGDGDGVTDAARVGVPADEVPPPPSVPRLPNLTPEERAIESEFADAYQNDPGAFAKAYLDMVRMDNPPKFETDLAKMLHPAWKGEGKSPEERAEVRSTMNTPLHQTANAIAKKAFVDHLDSLSEEDRKKGVFVTVGGCGAGKGFALKTLAANGVSEFDSKQYAAVWDSAGDQNATENPWILEEATKRGIPVTYAYVSADPEVSWADPKRGVVHRAEDPKDGRMVDAKVFADSYVIGAKNHDAFFKKNRNKATFVFVQNGSKIERLAGVPQSDLARDRRKLYEFASRNLGSAPPRIKRGASVGSRIWPSGRHGRG